MDLSTKTSEVVIVACEGYFEKYGNKKTPIEKYKKGNTYWKKNQKTDFFRSIIKGIWKIWN